MDITTQVLGLQDAKMRMELARKRIKMEIEHDYRQRAQTLIEERTRDAELEFAREIKRANDAGVPQAVIRKEVLRTNAWDRWTYWRDLAEIEPDRIRVQNTKEAKRKAASAFQISDDGLVLTVTEFRGTPLTDPVEYDLSTLRKVGGRWWPDAFATAAERAAMSVAGGGGVWTRWLDEGIEKEFSEGRLTPVTQVEED